MTIDPQPAAKRLRSATARSLATLLFLWAGAAAEGAERGEIVPCQHGVTATGGCDCCPQPAPYYAPSPSYAPTPPGYEYAPGATSPTPTPYEFDGQTIEPSPADQFQPDGGADAFAGGAPPTAPSGLGAVAAAESAAPHMIGDYFGGGYYLVTGTGLPSLHFSTVPIAGGDRRFKATDNLSPMPQDRVFFNYHHFHNAVVDIAGDDRNVNRYTFGLERTFFNGMGSLEVRVPFAGGLNNTQDTRVADTTASEFGNVSLTVKTRLHEMGRLTFTSGLATILPTARDGSATDGTFTAVLENKAVHLQPYLGVTCADPCSRLFSTAYMAIDFDVNGNRFLSSTGSTLVPVDTVRDQTMLFADWQIGYWCYQDYGHIGYLNAVAPVFELHYSRTLNEPDVPFGLENPFGTVDLLNVTAGLMFDFRRTARLTVYGAAPLLRNEEFFLFRDVSPIFQSEFGVQCVWNY